LWSMDDLFDAVVNHGAEKAERKRLDARIARLIARLKRDEK
jgi:hypothetical protein